MRIVGQKDDRGDQTPVPVILVIQMEAQNLLLNAVSVDRLPAFSAGCFCFSGEVFMRRIHQTPIIILHSTFCSNNLDKVPTLQILSLFHSCPIL